MRQLVQRKFTFFALNFATRLGYHCPPLELAISAKQDIGACHTGIANWWSPRCGHCELLEPAMRAIGIKS